MSIVITRTDDLEACMALRFTVFVDEQGVPAEIERDEYDAAATHLLATIDGKPMGTARIVTKGDAGKIGRVCVLPAARGTGLGAALIAACMDQMADDPHITQAILTAQTSAIGFYEKLGFVAEGDEFEDAGIPHLLMRKTL
jgi:predicted GNAT family N-acyltransferase